MTCQDIVTGVPAETEMLLAAKEEICGDAPVGGIRGELRGKDFDGYGAIQARVARTVHFAHAPGAERGKYFIGAKVSAWGKRHKWARL